jgi:hypothetical protein
MAVRRGGNERQDAALIAAKSVAYSQDATVYGMLAALGIEQGRPFAPDARMKAILERSAKAGRA